MTRTEGPIEARMKADSVSALKAGDRRTVTALRTVVAALKKARIDAARDPTEADELAVLGRERKQRLEAIQIYRESGREDLADQARFEAQLVSGYLPAELSDEELAALIEAAIGSTGAASQKEMGKVMAQLMPKIAGRADGKRVSDAVRARLGAS